MTILPALAAAVAASSPLVYRVTLIDPDPALPDFGLQMRMNDSAQITGVGDFPPNLINRAFRWSAGRLEILSVPQGVRISRANDIAKDGTVIGAYEASSGRAALWLPDGTRVDLNPGGVSGEGKSAGASLFGGDVSFNGSVASLWNRDLIREDLPRYNGSTENRLANVGDKLVSGGSRIRDTSFFEAWTWSRETGFVRSEPFPDHNAKDQATGGTAQGAFRWENGVFTNLDAPGSEGYRISDAGDVLGRDATGELVVWPYEGGKIVVRRHTDKPIGRVDWIGDINSRGQIVIYARLQGSNRAQPMLLTPTVRPTARHALPRAEY
jgi:uncharacterized membrane protein